MRRPSAETVVFLVISVVFGVAMVFITPPFQVPDEVGHFWHSYALARGELFPRISGGRAVVNLPEGARDLVATLWINPGTHTNFSQRMRTAAALPYVARPLELKYPVFYSPLPYLPQALGCFVGDHLRLRPLLTFYLGRLACLFAAIALIGLAIHLSDGMEAVVCAIALLPMALFLFASYSADAITIALACVATVLARRPGKALVVVAFVLGLCKPPYLLIVLLAFASRRWRIATVATAAAFAGAAIGIVFASSSTAATRPEANPPRQVQTLMHEPMRVASIVFRDLQTNSREYLDQLVGRLGWLDIQLPRPAYYAFVLLLLWTALTSGVIAETKERMAAAAIFVACVIAVELSQYIVWTPPSSNQLEGVQGRYFVPLLPLLFVAISHRSKLTRFTSSGIAVVAVCANAAAVAVLWHRYFG